MSVGYDFQRTRAPGGRAARRGGASRRGPQSYRRDDGAPDGRGRGRIPGGVRRVLVHSRYTAVPPGSDPAFGGSLLVELRTPAGARRTSTESRRALRSLST